MAVLWREIALFLFITAVVALVAWSVVASRRAQASARQDAELERLATLKSAIEKGVLRDADRDRVLDVLTPPRRAPALSSVQWLTALGWLAGFVGIGLYLQGGHEERTAGIMTAMIGFGCVTLPLALREVGRNRIAPDPPSRRA